MKKIIGIFIMTLLLTPFIVNSENTDVLMPPGVDQEQTHQDGHGYKIHPPYCCAQSFKPTIDKLTAVQLYFFSNDNPTPGAIVTVSIRDNFQGDDLTSVSVSADSIGEYNWISFDFPDIDIIPEKTYIIVCRCTEITEGTYNWFVGDNNPYDRGNAYNSIDNGESWDIITEDDVDFCFKTWYTEEENIDDEKYLFLSDNLLPNPSFEEEEDNNPVGWHSYSGSGATMSYVKDDGNTGEKCVSISNIGSGYFDDRWVTNDLIPVDFMENNYDISSYYKYIGEYYSSLQIAIINMNFYDENQEYISQFASVLPYSLEWTFSRYNSKLFSNSVKQNTKFIRFDLLQVSNDGNPDNNLITMFDDVYFGMGYENNPPTTPIIIGPTEGKKGESYDYEIMSTDPNNDKLKYNVEFEEDQEYQTFFYVSGETVIQSWTWNETGDYTIRVQAEDTFGAKSDWGTLEISMPKTKSFNVFNPWISRLIEHFPILEYLL